MFPARQGIRCEDSCSGCHFSGNQDQRSHDIDTGGECNYCHRSVGSNDAHNISTNRDSFNCMFCHSELNPTTSSLGAHKNLQCVDCHTAHGPNGGYRLVKSVVSLCSETCHTADQLGKSHPVGQGVIDKSTGTELTCVSTCHSVHNSRDDKLLQFADTDLCLQCHTEKF